ncbi:pentapeptide repeat-containing protein [Actinomadura mexicana]|uniref:pentapeptide repeat-containing protein n=1 Tax=Actinomadura mexicana TaxID=134959 RepID=UPI000B78096C
MRRAHRTFRRAVPVPPPGAPQPAPATQGRRPRETPLTHPGKPPSPSRPRTSSLNLFPHAPITPGASGTARIPRPALPTPCASSFACSARAHLRRAHLRRAHLRRAHLRRAHLRRAHLRHGFADTCSRWRSLARPG